LAEDPEAPITYRHTGAVWPAHTEARMDLYRHLAGVSRAAGFDLALVTPAEIEAMHPYWRAGESVIGGIHDPYEGDIDPSQLTQALARHARAKGAEIARHTRVTGLAQRASGDWAVETSRGTVIAGTVVNAAGSSGAAIAAMAGLHLPLATLEHQYMVTAPLPALEADPALFPLIRDPDIRFYLRRERASFLLGSYAHEGRARWREGVPADFDHQLFEDDVESIMAVLEATIAHVPLLAEAGAQRFVNGPIPYAPDAQPLVGPAAGVRNFYHATGVQIGITHSAAIGKAIAEWLTAGETEWDLAAWDPRRFGPWASAGYAAARAAEHYGLQYAIPYPNRILQAGRPVQATPLRERLCARGAVMGQIGGWERAMWFERDGAREDGTLSFGPEPWQRAVRAECETVRDAVGIMDHGGFTKVTVEGPGAADWLATVFCSAMPAPGRLRLSYMLTPEGRIWSEATIARLAPERFLLCGPTLAVDRDFDWLMGHAPPPGLRVAQGHPHDAALMVMGPRARAVLAPLTEADLSANAAPWLSAAEITLAGAPVTALRVSYVGELGWELHLASSDLARVYEAIREAGSAHGLCDFGSRALNAMRIEKGYHAWGADFGAEYTLFDAGLGRFARRANGYTGGAAVARQRETPPDWEFVGLEIADPVPEAPTPEAPAPGPEPLASDPIVKDGAVIGYVTSASHGYRTGRLLALGYVRRGALAMGEQCAVSAFGRDRAARRHNPHVYDPENARLKA
ncbi:MAG: FAD-dependent oxidoreductase, partial [Pseudomonadota bacterium]